MVFVSESDLSDLSNPAFREINQAHSPLICFAGEVIQSVSFLKGSDDLKMCPSPAAQVPRKGKLPFQHCCRKPAASFVEHPRFSCRGFQPDHLLIRASSFSTSS